MTLVPNISNQDRAASYSPVAPTANFIVPWPVIAESETLAADDLAVFVDGVRLASSDFVFSGTGIAGLNGIWNGGTVTLDTAVSGVRVVIYSKRDPRRTGYFLEGKALPMTTLDQLMNDVVVQLRDLHLTGKRSLKISYADFADDMDPVLGSFAAGAYLRVNADGDGFEAVAAVNDPGSYTASGSGAIARSITARLGDIVSVKDYGATGNGVTDDTAAFVAALATGKDVYVPKGAFLITRGLTMATSYQTLFGTGPLSEVRFTFSVAGVGTTVSSSTERQTVRGLYLHGTANVTKLVSVKAPGVAIEGNRLVNTSGHVVYGEDENPGFGIYSFGLALRNNFIYGKLTTLNYGVRLGLNSQTSRIVGNAIENCGTLVKVEGATSNLIIRDNTLERSIDRGVDLDKSGSNPFMSNITIEDNYFEENQVCIRAAGGEFHDISIRRNRASRNTAAKLNSFFYLGDTGASAASDDIYVEENHIEDFDVAFGLADEYTARLRGLKGNTLLNCNGYSSGTYAESAYDIRTLNSYYTRKLISGAFLGEDNTRLASKAAVFEQPLLWHPHEYLEKITFDYVQVAGTGVTVELRSVTSAVSIPVDSLVGTVTANTDGVKTITVGGNADATLNYYLKVTYDNTGTTGYVYPFRMFIRK